VFRVCTFIDFFNSISPHNDQALCEENLYKFLALGKLEGSILHSDHVFFIHQKTGASALKRMAPFKA